MKTLVIHPTDSSTDFLSRIYQGKGFTVINSRGRKKDLREAIKEHDRIIMMGHGCERGLFDGDYSGIIDSNWVYLLRQKECIAIWCNADVFFLKYGLKGLYTGMIVSEYEEAVLYCVNCDYTDIQNSNLLFAQTMTTLVEDYDLQKFKSDYSSESNNVIKFNNANVYLTENAIA